MRLRRMLYAVLMLSCLTSCGLGIGPQVKTEYIIAHPGHPARVVENVKVKVKVLPEGASEPVEQDIGAWMVMPEEHFQALMRALEAKTEPAPAPVPEKAP